MPRSAGRVGRVGHRRLGVQVESDAIWDGRAGGDTSRAHDAVEMEDLVLLRSLLDAGVDVEATDLGMTLLQHAVDVEVDGHVQTGGPLHVDTTALLLARGADPLAPGPAGMGSALALARKSGHWLAVELFTSHLRRTGSSPERSSAEGSPVP